MKKFISMLLFGLLAISIQATPISSELPFDEIKIEQTESLNQSADHVQVNLMLNDFESHLNYSFNSYSVGLLLPNRFLIQTADQTQMQHKHFDFESSEYCNYNTHTAFNCTWYTYYQANQTKPLNQSSLPPSALIKKNTHLSTWIVSHMVGSRDLVNRGKGHSVGLSFFHSTYITKNYSHA